MATAVFHIEIQVQNIDSDEHIEVVEGTIGQLTSMVRANLIMILGEMCLPKVTAYGESFARGRWTINVNPVEEAE